MPQLSDFNASVTFAENTVNAAPQLIDADVDFTDAEGDFDGGTLVMSGLLAEDRIAIRNQGADTGQIGVAGSNVTYGGIIIGTFAAEPAGSFTVTLNDEATSAAVDALIQNLTYANVSDTPTEARVLTLNVTDASGMSLPASGTVRYTALTGADNPLASVDVGYGSQPAFVDLDGDGDLDLVVGEFNGRLLSYRNDDGAFTQLTGGDNPFNGIDPGAFSSPVFFDADGDGDLDLVLGSNDGTLRTFRNDSGAFTQVFNAANPFQSIDVGRYSTPAFGDLDGDGDLDLVVGEYYGTLKAFRNDGGTFTQLTGTANPLGAFEFENMPDPAFADLNGDGDADIVVGSNDGQLRAFLNDGAGGFNEVTGAANPVGSIDIGSRSRPEFADLDGDGNLDLVVGEDFGRLFTFANTTPPGSQIAVNVTPENDGPVLADFITSVTFNEQDVNAAPQLIDSDVAFDDPQGEFDGGKLTVSGLLAEDRIAIRNEGPEAGQIGISDANVTYGGTVIGTFEGGAGGTFTVTLNDAATSEAVDALIQNLTYANVSETPTASRDLILNVTDAAGSPIATRLTYAARTGAENPFDGVDGTFLARPTLADLDADGDLDLVMGDETGKLRTFRNEAGIFTELTDDANPFNGIDIGTHSAPAFADLDGDGDLDLVTGANSGELLTYRNDAGVFTELTGADNPFNGVDLGRFSTPSFGDVDGDGDLDLVVGEYSTSLHYFENDGGSFTQRTGAANPFNSLALSLLPAPELADIDGDGDVDLLTGDLRGELRSFRNDGGAFTELTGDANPFGAIDVGENSAATLGDIDGDGDLDLVVGNEAATLATFENITSVAVPFTINVTSVDDAMAVDDTGTTDEASTTVIAVLTNDSDADGPPPSVSAINGTAVAAGETVTLDSGATATLNANGTITYNPNGKFNTLTSNVSGAVNTSATDTFSYSLAGGAATANVTVTVNGVAGPGDRLEGDDTDNVITGTPQKDFFDLRQGGEDTASGLAGNDSFYMGAALSSGDAINGGVDVDTLALQGDYSSLLTFGSGVVDIELIALLSAADMRFGGGGWGTFSYNLATVQENVAAGGVLRIDAVQLQAGENFTFNGSAETDGGRFRIAGGRGVDNLTTGSGSDSFHFTAETFGADDRLNGGAGTDQLALQGNFDLTFGAEQLSSIELIALLSGREFGRGDFSYDITTVDENVGNGQRLGIDAAGLRAGETLTFDGSAETDGFFRIAGGAGADTLKGGGLGDVIEGRAGADQLTGNGGNDRFLYREASHSTAAAEDQILDFTLGDLIDLSGIDARTGGNANDSFAFIGSGAFSGQAGQLRAELTSVPNVWTVQGDIDGNGSADFQLQVIVADLHPLTAADFVL